MGKPPNSRFHARFPFDFIGDRVSSGSTNLKSCDDLPEIVTLKLKSELSIGRISGPFQLPPFEPFRVSLIGLVPKKHRNNTASYIISATQKANQSMILLSHPFRQYNIPISMMLFRWYVN